MSHQLYRHLIEGGVNFDYYKRYAESTPDEMPHGTIVEYDTDGAVVGFFVRVAPFWGMMYDGDTLYRRPGFGGTDDQLVGHALNRHLFVPVRQADVVVVEEFSNGVFESAAMSGFSTLDPGRYAVVRLADR